MYSKETFIGAHFFAHLFNFTNMSAVETSVQTCPSIASRESNQKVRKRNRGLCKAVQVSVGFLAHSGNTWEDINAKKLLHVVARDCACYRLRITHASCGTFSLDKCEVRPQQHLKVRHVFILVFSVMDLFVAVHRFSAYVNCFDVWKAGQQQTPPVTAQQGKSRFAAVEVQRLLAAYCTIFCRPFLINVSQFRIAYLSTDHVRFLL